jgi:toxin ParE1/3/4
MTIVWTKTARTDLRALRKFIARDSVFQADRMVGRIIERVERVAQRPGTGHPVHEFPEKSLKEIHEPPYRIIYSCDNSVFLVIALVHFKQRRRLA